MPMVVSTARGRGRPAWTMKLALLSLLAVQIGCQPLLMGWFARDAEHVGLRVGVIELLKLLMALLPLVVTGDWVRECKDWDLHRALQTTAAPALIYVLQNYLNQAAVVVLDGVTFNVLNQTKIIWTALLVYLLLRRHQSRQQILALTILCGAAVLMTTGKTTAPHDGGALLEQEEAVAASEAAFVTGAYQALIAAMLSALAGTIIQRALQTQQRNAYVVTMELSVLGELTILLWSLTTSHSGFFAKPQLLEAPAPDDAGRDPASDGIWAGWTLWTLLALMCQAGGGVLVGVVIKYCGNVEKSFSVVAGMIITALLETHYNHKPFGLRGVAAIALVTVATALYAMYPPRRGGVAVVVEEDRDVDVDGATRGRHTTVLPLFMTAKRKSSGGAEAAARLV